MPLSAALRLGHYEVVSDRTVAVKVLPSHIASRDDLRARFEREARAVPSLNHLHICTLFDIGREGDIDYMLSLPGRET